MIEFAKEAGHLALDIVGALVLVLLGIIGFFLVRHFDKIDKMEERMRKMENEAITKREIMDSLGHITDRVDVLYERIATRFSRKDRKYQE